MPAEVCLQGGAEFQPGCESMDTAMLARPGLTPRRVVVAPFAGRPGRERQIAARNAERWYRSLGARDVVAVLDDTQPFADALTEEDLLVLPGGSPARLLEALTPHADGLRAALARGTAISGASAGAMVLCRWTVLPAVPPRVVPALAMVAVDLVLPHYRGRSGWLRAARTVLPADAVVVGLPERSGIVVRPDGSRHQVGLNLATLLTA
ncbi:MAG: Type 1 glutamine amidotransferase-like domain-containing protein [Kineosporiaceae bacterium]